MSRSARVVLALVALVVVGAIGVAGWLVGRSGPDAEAAQARAAAAQSLADLSGSGAIPPLQVGVPRIVSKTELQEIAAYHAPVYWAGERPGTQLEVTATANGGIFIRYLEEGAFAGTSRETLTVGTYAMIDGYTSLAGAVDNDADIATSDGGAIIATFKSDPKSTYFAFKDTAFQVEVFSPKDGESRKLVDDGSIVLVGPTPEH